MRTRWAEDKKKNVSYHFHVVFSFVVHLWRSADFFLSVSDSRENLQLLFPHAFSALLPSILFPSQLCATNKRMSEKEETRQQSGTRSREPIKEQQIAIARHYNMPDTCFYVYIHTCGLNIKVKGLLWLARYYPWSRTAAGGYTRPRRCGEGRSIRIMWPSRVSERKHFAYTSHAIFVKPTSLLFADL